MKPEGSVPRTVHTAPLFDARHLAQRASLEAVDREVSKAVEGKSKEVRLCAAFYLEHKAALLREAANDPDMLFLMAYEDPELFEKLRYSGAVEWLKLACDCERKAKAIRALVADPESINLTTPAEPTQLSGPRPVLGLRTPPGEPSKGPRGQRTRRTGAGWLKLHLAETDIMGLQAMAQCYGTSLDQIVRWGIGQERTKFEQRFGMRDFQAAKLSRRQRDALAEQYAAVRNATLRTGLAGVKN